jgi:hypothetical protein
VPFFSLEKFGHRNFERRELILCDFEEKFECFQHLKYNTQFNWRKYNQTQLERVLK